MNMAGASIPVCETLANISCVLHPEQSAQRKAEAEPMFLSAMLARSQQIPPEQK